MAGACLCTGAEQEHAAVPVACAFLEIGLGRFEIRFFLEAGHRKAAVADLLATADVAKAGFGAGGHDTESDEPAFLGKRLCP